MITHWRAAVPKFLDFRWLHQLIHTRAVLAMDVTRPCADFSSCQASWILRPQAERSRHVKSVTFVVKMEQMRASVKDPLVNRKGASCWAGMLERSQVLKHLVIIFHTSEFEIGNVRSPGCFALYFISEAIAYFLRPHGGEQPIARTRIN